VLEDEILEMLGRVDQLIEDAARADANLEKGRLELARVTQHVEDSTDLIRADIERVRSELAQAESQLPGDFRAEYLRVVRLKGADGIAAVEDRVCTSCGQQVTLNTQNTLAMSRPAFCQSCGAVLYRGA
jgi:predicted  nucleic acid-binding Zn-ribbon protein